MQNALFSYWLFVRTAAGFHKQPHLHTVLSCPDIILHILNCLTSTWQLVVDNLLCMYICSIPNCKSVEGCIYKI